MFESKKIHTNIKLGIILGIFFAIFSVYQWTSAATIKMFSDKLSTSAPSASSNHTITFTTDVTIPANGFIRFTPEDGDFEIPATNFDIDNVAIYVDIDSNGFMQRDATSSPSSSEDGIVITPGSSGNIEITLNSSEGIPEDAQIRILLGTHTPNATSTDVGITNPASPGTYQFSIEAGNGGNVSAVRGKYAIIEQVTVGDVDTRETIPPVRSQGGPLGNISGTSISVELSLQTDEFSRCRYSTASGTPYFSMTNEFSGTNFVAIHSKVISIVASTSYSFFVRCIDDEGNANLDDYEISFTVLPTPSGTPGSDGDTEGQGAGTGEGAGDSDPGIGDPSGDDNSSGGSTGGGGSGGGGGGGSGPSSAGSDGGGGFEGVGKPYQSGDGQVVITGYAFPRSKVVALVDGVIVEEKTTASSGEFSITISEIARGSYNFGIYGVDRAGVKSSTFTTSFLVTGSRSTALSNINVMPSVKVSPDPVDPNSVVTISGYTIPNAVVTIENQNDKSSASLKTFTATSDANGAWSVQVSTDGFSKGTYKARAKALQESGAISTSFSGYTFYGVGESKSTGGSSDLSRDGKVNLTDFSILLFWWNSNGGTSNPSADINGDGKVSLTDFSILIFNWTG